MPLTDQRKAEILNALYGGAALTVGANIHVALSTTTPTSAGANFTEPVGSGYARVQVANNVTNFPAATVANPAVKNNGTEIAFPAATGNWGTVTHFGLWTAATGGTLLDWGALPTSKTIGAGDTARFAVGALVMRQADG